MPPKFTPGQQARLNLQKDSKRKLRQEGFEASEAQPLLGPDSPVAQKDKAIAAEATYIPKDIEAQPVIEESEKEIVTSTELLEEGIAKDTGTQPIVNQLAKIGVFDDETNKYFTGKNLEEKKAIDTKLTEELSVQDQRATRLTPESLKEKDPEMTNNINNLKNQILYNKENEI